MHSEQGKSANSHIRRAVICLIVFLLAGETSSGNVDGERRYFIEGTDRAHQFGTLAQANEICAIFGHPFFSQTGLVRSGPGRAIREPQKPGQMEDGWGRLIDPHGLSRQWLSNRSAKIRDIFYSSNAVDAKNWRRSSASADENLTVCLRQLKEVQSERYANVIKIFSSTNLPLSKCLSEVTETKRSISEDGKISEQTETRRSERCYNTMDRNVYNDRLIDLMNMVMLREAHPAIISLLDEAEKAVSESNAVQDATREAERQAESAERTEQTAEAQALGAGFEDFSSARIEFDASPGMGQAAGLTIGRLVQCTRKTPKRPEVTAEFHAPNIYKIRTTVGSHGTIENTFYLAERPSWKAAIPSGLKVSIRDEPQSDTTIGAGRLVKPNQGINTRISKDQEAFAYMQVVADGMCGCGVGPKCSK